MRNTSDGNSEKRGQESQAEASASGGQEQQAFLGGIPDIVSGAVKGAQDIAGRANTGASGGSSQGAIDSAGAGSSQSGGGGIFGDRGDIFGGQGDSGSAAPPADQSAAGPASGEGTSLGSVDTSGASGTMGADASATPAEEEPWQGSGGVGSPEFYENLRKAHEAAGGEYTSDLGDPNRSS